MLAATALALASSLCWGTGDFLGGLRARKLPALVVLAFSQVAGLAFLIVAVAAAGAERPELVEVWPAAAGGLAGAIGLGCFYRALAVGTMSIVAPISATAAGVPVVVGLASGDDPSGVQLAGLIAAMVGVVLAARDEYAGPSESARAAIPLALVAALGFGWFFVGLDGAADADPLWATLTARSVSVVACLSVVAIVRPPGAPPPSAQLPAIALIGVLDVAANVLFAVASTKGLLSVVGVLGSLYPLATVALARVVLGERVRPVQQVGVGAALAGVVLISAG